MNDEFISIESHYNPSPHRQRRFTVECFTARILTTVTSTPSVVRSWIYKIRYFHRFRCHKLVVGLGVQWRPSFTAGVSSPPATLQLCVERRCLIFQLLHALSVLVYLRRFLFDPLITFVGVRNHNNEALLRRSKHSLSLSTLDSLLLTLDMSPRREGG
ncbi:hypothetical protein L1049_001658 [Liquidambar formosana]|uniref:Uncharacterized protein n=1 Tax=Liquidambar formosana TaxID=63359 RepID=A0AAP0N8U5_LIQFO